MIRKAFIMSLHPGRRAEYKKRHDEIWPELSATLRQHGVHNYSIYLNEATGQLFAYVEIESESRWNQIAQTEVCKRWWAHMRDIMASNPDNSPVSVELPEMFHMD